MHQRLAAICLIRTPKLQRRPIIGPLTARGLFRTSYMVRTVSRRVAAA
nr:MAG TPA: hypothetical protein [Caudoviricetes sp.]